jgi:hypothetical protein
MKYSILWKGCSGTKTTRKLKDTVSYFIIEFVWREVLVVAFLIVSSSITTEYVVRFVISNYEIKEVMIEELNKKKVWWWWWMKKNEY